MRRGNLPSRAAHRVPQFEPKSDVRMEKRVGYVVSRCVSRHIKKVQRAASADEPGKENVDLKNCFALVVV